MQREQPYWGPKEKASQKLVAYASDAASAEPLPCATRSQSIGQPFHDSARAPRTRALAKPKPVQNIPSHSPAQPQNSDEQRVFHPLAERNHFCSHILNHFCIHLQRGTIFAATCCRIHDNPKPVQNIPLHSPAKPQGSDAPFFHPLAERNHFCSHILQNPRQSQASSEHSLA